MKALKELFFSGKGSILMEFVMVMPLYITTLGGIFWIGYKSLDATNLRPSANWSVWSANRYASPSISDLLVLFPRANSVSNNLKRSLKAEKSYLEFVASNASINFKKPEFIETWQQSVKSFYGESENVPEDKDTQMTSSKYGNEYTQYLTMRTKGSIRNTRLLNASQLADKKYWKFNTDRDVYPEKWETKLITNAKNTNDNFTDSEAQNDQRKDFYDRYSKYAEWSFKK